MNKINPTIARLDRDARRMGIDLKERGVNRREFSYGDRLLTYKPGGKGVVRIEAVVDGRLDSTVVCGPERVRAIWSQMVASRTAEEGHARLR